MFCREIKERSYLVIKAKEVKTVKEVIRSDGLWRFACGDVFGVWGGVLGIWDILGKSNSSGLSLIVKKNIATGKTSQAITPYHLFHYSNFFGFYH